MDWTYILGFLACVGLFGYLTYALIKPEKF
jgi:K+-transporting ATPase KdpF subunit